MKHSILTTLLLLFFVSAVPAIEQEPSDPEQGKAYLDTTPLLQDNGSHTQWKSIIRHGTVAALYATSLTLPLIAASQTDDPHIRSMLGGVWFAQVILFGERALLWVKDRSK